MITLQGCNFQMGGLAYDKNLMLERAFSIVKVLNHILFFCRNPRMIYKGTTE